MGCSLRALAPQYRFGRFNVRLRLKGRRSLRERISPGGDGPAPAEEGRQEKQLSLQPVNP
jgi:hypothetical protein